MRIDHAAIFVADLEKARDFFLKYFSGTSNNGYYMRKPDSAHISSLLMMVPGLKS